ncbi:MmgE/PrpD family protein [Leptolyngbya sp. 15MV]|nr:MmgE/PrpD family protein [Leptolyngbya sp. 15MV]
MSEPLLVQLAASLARSVGESERKRARLHLLDWLACVAGARGAELFAGDVLERAALRCNVLEMDDVHRLGRLHPGPVVWPAALAAHAAMDDLLDAAVRGYEAMIAVGETLDDRHYAHFHPTATAGVFGAAAATASSTSMASALGFAGSVCGGLWQMRHEPGAGKQWHVLHAVETGRRAAAFAQAGNPGPVRLLEGPQGLYAARFPLVG